MIGAKSFLAFFCIAPNRGNYRQKGCARHGFRVITMSENTELSKFCQDVLNEFDENIADAVFCYVQSNKTLMCRYLALVRKHDKGKQIVNSQLAQAITREFDLKSTKHQNKTPNSVLIESFSELEEK